MKNENSPHRKFESDDSSPNHRSQDVAPEFRLSERQSGWDAEPAEPTESLRKLVNEAFPMDRLSPSPKLRELLVKNLNSKRSENEMSGKTTWQWKLSLVLTLLVLIGVSFALAPRIFTPSDNQHLADNTPPQADQFGVGLRGGMSIPEPLDQSPNSPDASDLKLKSNENLVASNPNSNAEKLRVIDQKIFHSDFMRRHLGPSNGSQNMTHQALQNRNLNLNSEPQLGFLISRLQADPLQPQTTMRIWAGSEPVDVPDGQQWRRKTSRRIKFPEAPLAGELDPTALGLSTQQVGRAFRSEQYDPIIENEFLSVQAEDAFSTFSIDVDTASYANVRRFIQQGKLPPPNAVRIEELVNYFTYEYQPPKGDEPFAVDLEVADCPWRETSKLVRIAIQGKKIHRNERPASNLVFLIDVSGSMRDQNKLPLLQRSLMMMLDRLSENDRISIVTYAGQAGVRLTPTSGDQKIKIRNCIEQLTSGGSTNGSAGIEKAYQLATQHYIPEGTNRVILATDGDLNVGVTQDDQLVELIQKKAKEGVFLTVLGVGSGNLKDSKLEKLADHGNGFYAYLDSLREAHKVLVEQMSSSLVTIAKDVKLQVEFNPAEVAKYRLIGYENRQLANEDFANDEKDAGEIGAGHSATALYEIVPAGMKTSSKPLKSKYQNPSRPQKEDNHGLSQAANSGELLTLAIRYKKPEGTESTKNVYTLKKSDRKFYDASREFRFAAAVAAFGQKLRKSAHQGQLKISEIEKIAVDALGDDPSGYRAEFVDLIRKISKL